MLYTSYIANFKNIPDDSIKIIITRFLPPSFNIKSYKKCFYAPNLSPSESLLKKYKKDNNWEEYVKIFKKEKNNSKVYEYLKRIKAALDAGNDVFLICYEKSPLRCHRTLIAEMLKAMGCEYKEFVKK